MNKTLERGIKEEVGYHHTNDKNCNCCGWVRLETKSRGVHMYKCRRFHPMVLDVEELGLCDCWEARPD